MLLVRRASTITSCLQRDTTGDATRRQSTLFVLPISDRVWISDDHSDAQGYSIDHATLGASNSGLWEPFTAETMSNLHVWGTRTMTSFSGVLWMASNTWTNNYNIKRHGMHSVTRLTNLLESYDPSTLDTLHGLAIFCFGNLVLEEH